MQDRPTAAELLDAAREFLENEVLGELSGRKQFHLRVTINVLAMLGREWEHEEPAVRAEHARLSALLGRTQDAPPTFAAARDAVRELNRELASAIRAGAFDARFDEALACVRANVTDALRIANPRWLRDGDGS